MLSTNPTSRARLIGGIAAVGMLTIAGLGVTASGTQAAERIRTKIEKTARVTLAAPALPAFVAQSLPAPETPAAPAPPARSVPAAPPEPPAPPTAESASSGIFVTTPDGKVREAHKVVMRPRDASGKIRPDPDITAILARTPEVVSRDDCPVNGKAKQVVLHEQDGTRQRIIICTNTIARLESDAIAAASVDTGAIQRNAYRSALAGVRAGRAAVLANQKMSEEARAKALAGMDTAIAELESQVAEAK